MRKVVDFLKRHRKKIQIIFSFVFLAIVFSVVLAQMKTVDFGTIRKMTQSMSILQKIETLTLGLFAFSFVTGYDRIFNRYFEMNVSNRRVFIIGWVAQSFNSFIGLAGVVAGAVRAKLYAKEGCDKEKVLKLMAATIMTNLLGLFVLALPAMVGLSKLGLQKYMPIFIIAALIIPLFLYGNHIPLKITRSKKSPLHFLNLNVKLQSVGVSTLQWFAAAAFFSHTIRLFQPNVPFTVSLLIYIVATIIGIMSLLPGGFGSFDASCVLFFRALGYQTSVVILSLVLFRLIYTILPWVLGMLVLGFGFVKSKMQHAA